MTWKQPPIIKIYEALGSIADGRVTIQGNTAKVRSSSGNKTYDVVYDSQTNAINTNDNGSYWQGYLGYPGIAFLLLKGVIPYQSRFAEALKGIAWKDINQSHKNDFAKTERFVRDRLMAKGVDLVAFDDELRKIQTAIQEGGFIKLGANLRPPDGY